MQPEQKRTVSLELLDVIVKSWWTLVASVCLGLVGAKLLLHVVPKTYEASTLVRVAPPSIPERMIDTTVTEDIGKRLLAVQESILTRDYLGRVLEQHGSLPEDPAELEDALNTLRSRIDVLTDKQTSMFSLVHQDSDPERTAAVVNTLTRLYIDDNAEFRARRASETAETFKTMADQARREMEIAEQKLTQFKSEHHFQTEGALELNMQRIDVTQKTLSDRRNERMLAEQRLEAAVERRRVLEQTLTSAVPVPGAETVSDPTFRQLAEAQRAYEAAKARYTESHPEVKRTERELARVRELLSGSSSEGAPLPVDPRLAVIDEDIEALRMTIAGLIADEQALQRELATVDRRIETTPETQRRLSELENLHTIAKQKYDDLSAKAEASQGAVKLEGEQKGARLEVVEWATVPFKPVSPKPPIVISIAIAGGLLVFVGPLFARTLLNPMIRSEAGLKAAAVGLPVLVDIPRIETRETLGLSRRQRMRNVALSLLSAAALAAVMITL